MTDDPVNPAHYADLGEYAAIHVIQRWRLGFNLGQVLKYIQRAGHKPGESEVTDLKKAKWYIERAIHELDPDEPDPSRPKFVPPTYYADQEDLLYTHYERLGG